MTLLLFETADLFQNDRAKNEEKDILPPSVELKDAMAFLVITPLTSVCLSHTSMSALKNLLPWLLNVL